MVIRDAWYSAFRQVTGETCAHYDSKDQRDDNKGKYLSGKTVLEDLHIRQQLTGWKLLHHIITWPSSASVTSTQTQACLDDKKALQACAYPNVWQKKLPLNPHVRPLKAARSC